MIGCLGGLGRSLSQWMLERGARAFIFLSRSGAETAAAKDLVSLLQEGGAFIDIVKGDVSCRGDVKEMLEGVKMPIGGVIQAAMGLSVSDQNHCLAGFT